jgi:hypothetical protein
MASAFEAHDRRRVSLRAVTDHGDYFGVSRWSVFDLALVLLSVILVVYGTKGYRRAQLADRRIGELLANDRAGAGNVAWRLGFVRAISEALAHSVASRQLKFESA